MLDLLTEVRNGLTYVGDDQIVSILHNVPGILITYREFDERLSVQVFAPFETVTRYFQSQFGRYGEQFDDKWEEWQFENGMTVKVRRLPNTAQGSPSCRIIVDGAPATVSAALQESPKKGS